MTIDLQTIEVGSALHASQQRLRDEVLRKPLGRALSATDIERDKTGTLFAAVRGEEVVACLGLYPQAEGVLRLRQMAVSPSMQGQRLGARLLKFAEQWARRQGVAEIELHARQTAVGFYEANGYTGEGDEFEEIGLPHIVMRKRL
jgi:predicted GNAT family N-acyltransferase